MDRILVGYPGKGKAEMRRKFVLLAIASYSLDGHTAHPGIDAIAERAHCERGVVRRCLHELIKEKWLRVVCGGGGKGYATEYELSERAWPEGAPERARKLSKRARNEVQMADPHNPSLDRDQQEENNNQCEPRLAVVVPMPTGRMLDVPSVADAVFDAWREATGRTGRTILTDKRRKVIEARVREGYRADDLIDAVRGWRQSPFHCGANESQTVYNELTLLLRDGEHVEKFRDLARGVGIVAAPMPNDAAAASIQRLRQREGRA